jgi:hypothetical protein
MKNKINDFDYHKDELIKLKQWLSIHHPEVSHEYDDNCLEEVHLIHT